MKGQILAFFSYFLKFGLACRKIEASQAFWYQGLVVNMVFRNSLLPVFITIDVPVIPVFPNFSGRPSPEIGKKNILGSSLKGLSTV